VSRFADQLRSGLGLEYGIDDQFAHIPTATTAFAQELAAARIPHRLEVFDGDHRNRFRERMATRVLPWVAEHLVRR
jgi:S-formylglutathione hydrolase FrmB